jgi:hypothetical protein
LPILLRHATLQQEARLRIGWYNEHRPHMTLKAERRMRSILANRPRIAGPASSHVRTGRAARPAPDLRCSSPDSQEIHSLSKCSSTADSTLCRSSSYAGRPEPSRVSGFARVVCFAPGDTVAADRDRLGNECVHTAPLTVRAVASSKVGQAEQAQETLRKIRWTTTPFFSCASEHAQTKKNLLDN